MTPKLPRADRWSILTFAGVFLLALAVRLLYVAEIAEHPLASYPIADARAYLEWARQLAAGDLWSRAQGVFYQAPLYPYFLAAVLGVAGEGLNAIRLVQAVAGALACALLVVAGRFFFDRAAALLAGIVLALYAPVVFTEALIQKEALAVFVTSGLLACLGWASLPAGPVTAWRWLAVGLALGVLCLLRENALLLAPVLALWLVLSGNGRRLGPRLLPAAALAVGLAVALAPVSLRNLAIGGGLTLTTAQAGPNFFIGNHDGATGSYQPLRAGRSDPRFERRDATEIAERALGRELAPAEVSGYWFGRAFSFLREQPLAWLALAARKVWMVTHRHELADAEDFYLFRESSPLLAGLSIAGNFGVLLPLAVAGVVLTWKSRRQLAPLYLTAATLLLSVAVFFVFGRYRLPAVPALALLAAAGLREAWRRAGVHGARRAAASLAPAALAAALVTVPVNLPPPAAWTAGAGMVYSNLGVALAGQGRLDEAIVQYEKAIALTPDLVEGHLNLGSTLLFQGRVEEALPHLERAAALQPQDAEIEQQLGVALDRRGDRAGAVAHLRRALELARRSGSLELAARTEALLRSLR